jgi:hypothetical protein
MLLTVNIATSEYTCFTSMRTTHGGIHATGVPSTWALRAQGRHHMGQM